MVKLVSGLSLRKGHKYFTLPKQAVKGLRFLLSEGYPLSQALGLIGNRFQLSAEQRHLLKRGVYSFKGARSRQRKKQGLWRLRHALLGIDGHNVLITVESALKNKPLLLADDGFIRDIAGVSANYRPSSATKEALNLIFKVLNLYSPLQLEWYFDAPLSYSGELAALVEENLKFYKLKGYAQAVSVPEYFLMGYELIATSDSELIDRSSEIVDLAGEALKFCCLPFLLYQFIE